MERDTTGRYIKGWSYGKWSRTHPRCVECNTINYRHQAFGYCKKCYQTHPNYIAAVKKYRSSPKWRRQKKEYDLRIRLEALRHYGNGNISCKCCGESDHRFLSFDHINGGGRQHLTSIKGYKLGQWLRKHEYPVGYQILCHNCNMSKGIYGICPHKL